MCIRDSECAAQDKYSFRSDVLCAMGDKLDLRAFLWDGFAAQLRTVQQYYERSMQLLDPAIRSELLCAELPILAKEDDEAASYICLLYTSGRNSPKRRTSART